MGFFMDQDQSIDPMELFPPSSLALEIEEAVSKGQAFKDHDSSLSDSEALDKIVAAINE